MANAFALGGAADVIEAGKVTRLERDRLEASTRLGDERNQIARDSATQKRQAAAREFHAKGFGTLRSQLVKNVETQGREGTIEVIRGPQMQKLIAQQAAGIFPNVPAEQATAQLTENLIRSVGNARTFEEGLEQTKQQESAKRVPIGEVTQRAKAARPTPAETAATAAAGRVPVGEVAERADAAREPIAQAAKRAGAVAGATRTPRTQVINRRAPNGDQISELVNLDTGEVIESFGQGPVVGTEIAGVPKVKRKEFSDFQQSEIDTLNFVQGASELVTQVREGGEQVLATPGALARGVNQFRSAVVGLAKLGGVDVGRFIDGSSATTASAKADKVFEDLGVANTSAQIKSRIVGLAFAAAAAVGQTGKGVSDKDFERFVRQIGGNVGDPKILESVISTVVDQVVRNISNTHRVKQGDLGLGPLRDFTRDTIFAPPEPDVSASQAPPGMTLVGTVNGKPVFEDANGQRFTQ